MELLFVRNEHVRGYTQLPAYSVNRLVLQQDDLTEQSGYQQREQTNCK